jgi:hypothetical protein
MDNENFVTDCVTFKIAQNIRNWSASLLTLRIKLN